METDWQNITRRLDINKSSRDDTYDKSRTKGRIIKKVPYRIVVPSITYNPVTDLGLPAGFAGLSVIGSLIATFHFTAPSSFRILQKVIEPNVGNRNGVLLAISYRVGTTVTRYQLRNRSESTINDDIMRGLMKVACPLYTNERIQKNFSIEYYSLGITNASVTKLELAIPTSLLAIPADHNEQYVDIECSQVVLRNEIDEAFPEPIPTTYTQDTTWITN